MELQWQAAFDARPEKVAKQHRIGQPRLAGFDSPEPLPGSAAHLTDAGRFGIEVKAVPVGDDGFQRHCIASPFIQRRGEPVGELSRIHATGRHFFRDRFQAHDL